MKSRFLRKLVLVHAPRGQWGWQWEVGKVWTWTAGLRQERAGREVGTHVSLDDVPSPLLMPGVGQIVARLPFFDRKAGSFLIF